MKKLFALFSVCICFALTANAQYVYAPDPPGCTPLGTAGITLDPTTVPMFENDLPVIKDLGLRIDGTNAKSRSMMVEMNETEQDLLGVTTTGTYMTRVWGYKFPGLPTTYPGATIVAQKNSRLVVRWENNLPGHFLPVDASLHMAHPSTIHGAAAVREWYDLGNVPTVAHLHGGHTESASDGLPEAWFSQNFAETGNYYVKKNYRYDNDQEAATLWYHDHALGITRLNVYAGLAGFYLLRDDNENNLINSGVLPGGDYEIEIVIQDRLFDTDGQLFWPAYKGETPYSDFIEPETLLDPYPVEFPEDGGPTALAEFFGNVILVNGKAWPKLDVEPRKYRFRLLNGSDSRFYILKLDHSHQIMIIGTDDGLLETPVNVDELVFAPGERYDVVIDFGSYTPSTDPGFIPKITLQNFGPDSPYGGPVDPEDEACPETTGQIMQFQVTKEMSTEFPDDATIDDESALNTINRFDPLAADNAGTPRQLVLFEGLDEFGRLQPMLGTMDDGSQTWSEPISENPAKNTTEIWEVYNATGDAHPIHLHLVKFQILNREEFTEYDDVGLGIEDNVEARDQIQHNGTYGIGGNFHLDTDTPLSGDVIDPEDYEKGWKDTFIVPPGQVGRVIAYFDRPGRYVWHCHILSHEDHEMMRPFHVGPIPPAHSGGKKGASVEDPKTDMDLQKEFRLYPNPVSDQATVEFVLAGDSPVTIHLYNVDGRIVKSENLGTLNEGFHNHTITVDDLDNGMYILELKAGDKQFRQSIIVSQ